MTTPFRKTIAASIAAVTIGLTIVATSTPAAAWGHRHHGRGALAAGVFGALAVGAIAANQGYAYSGDCYYERRAVTNYDGDVVGYRRVRICD